MGLPGKPAAGQEERTVVVTASAAAEDKGQEPKGLAKKEQRIVIETIEPEARKKGAKEVAWLGLATAETSEPLTAQLGLSAGEGLVVTYVAADSPAAKAGLEKNDVLVEFGDQLLVHPAQLRKLLQMHKAGDTVKLALYRGGKKVSVSATLAQTSRGLELPDDAGTLAGNLEEVRRQLGDLKLGENIRQQIKALREALAKSGIDKDKIQVDVSHNVEEARKAVREALRRIPDAKSALGPAMKDLEDLAAGGLEVQKNARTVVRNDRKSVKTVVQSGDAGAFVIVADPKKRLTAHDKNGKLTFDGPIETQAQQDKVPRGIWDKVKPMLDQMGPVKDKAEDSDQ